MLLYFLRLLELATLRLPQIVSRGRGRPPDMRIPCHIGLAFTPIDTLSDLGASLSDLPPYKITITRGYLIRTFEIFMLGVMDNALYLAAIMEGLVAAAKLERNTC